MDHRVAGLATLRRASEFVIVLFHVSAHLVQTDFIRRLLLGSDLMKDTRLFRGHLFEINIQFFSLAANNFALHHFGRGCVRSKQSLQLV